MMRPSPWPVAAAAAALLGYGPGMSAQSPAPAAKRLLPVEILDMKTGERIARVEVCEVLSSVCTTTTDSARLIDLASLSVRSPLFPIAMFTFRKPNYRPDTIELDLSRDTSARTVGLVPRPLAEMADSATRLPAVEVSESRLRSLGALTLSGFLDRRETYASHGAKFVTPGELRDQWDSYDDVRTLIASHGFCGPTYVDGHLQSGLEFTGPRAYAAIEYYPDLFEVPAAVMKQLDETGGRNPTGMPVAQRNRKCRGVILLWTTPFLR